VTPKPKNDLIKLFGVEGIVTPRSPAFDTKEELGQKTPSVLVQEVKVLMDEITAMVGAGDIDGIIKRLEATSMRVELMSEIAHILKKKFDE
jgi:hypothetical protein